jgi:hypothetical protein
MVEEYVTTLSWFKTGSKGLSEKSETRSNYLKLQQLFELDRILKLEPESLCTPSASVCAGLISIKINKLQRRLV